MTPLVPGYDPSSASQCALFAIGLPDDLSFEERPYATLAAQHFTTNPTEFVVETEAIALMERLLRHHDRPFGHSSAISTYLVSRLARQQVTVVLNGDWGATVKCVVRRAPLLKLQL